MLYKGLTGPDVSSWQNFLRGRNKTSKILANGTFDDFTVEETSTFQKTPPTPLDGDGEVGPLTYAKALKLGFNPLADDREDESGPGWPKRPAGIVQLSDSGRAAIFGTFKYEAAPTADNPEAIKILDDWAKNNIVSVPLPQLKGVKGAPKSGAVQFHRLGADQLQQAFKALETRGLIKHVLTWNGSWVPRFIRGSNTKLSNHSFGTAFDLNVEWNKLGTQGALKGQTGSVREIVLTMAEFGFYWGGWYGGRVDAMHFEVFKRIT